MITTHQPRRCALELEALPIRAQQVRRIVSAQLRYWHLDQVLDPALLGVTELLANVYRHAGPDKRCTVELTLDEGLLTVSVSDHDPRPPRTGPRPDTLETGGRGLALIEALTDAWGTRPAEDGAGKVVWFALCGPAPAPAVPDPVPAREAVAVQPATVIGLSARPQTAAVQLA